MKKIIFPILLIMIVLHAAIGDWRTYCSITQGNDIISFNDKIFVATDGGLIEYDGSKINIFDTDNGLYNINTTAVVSDFRNIIWAGHSDCSISLIDNNGNSVGFLNDIEEYGSYELNNIYSSDNYVYAATDHALVRYTYNSVFDKYDVKDSNIMTGNVSDVIVSPYDGDDYIYIATTSGVYSILEASSNIGYLANWKLLTGFDPATVVNKFINIGEVVIVLTSNGMYSIEDNIVTKKSPADGFNVSYGEVYNNEFYYLFNSGDMIINKIDIPFSTTPKEVFRTTDQKAKRFTMTDEVVYYISSSGFSTYDITAGITTNMSFNLPAEKGIKKVRVTSDNSKLLYLTSFGFRSYDLFKEEFNDEFYTESKIWWGKDFIEDNNENIYVCTWTTGIAKFSKSLTGYDFEQRYLFNGPLFANTHTHPGVCKDQKGNLWFTNFHNLDLDSTIVKFGIDGTIMPYSYSISEGTSANPFSIYVDNNDWVWIGSSSEQFNERDGLTVGVVKNASLEINNFTGLGGIISINKDKNDFVWIGTNNGIKYIDMNYANVDAPSDLLSSDIISMVEGPVGNMIYDIEISDINEKWFATDKGVSVLSADNSNWRHYVPVSYKDDGRLSGDVIYSAFPDNAITDIELDSENGLVIFSSYNGITMLEALNTTNLPDDVISTYPSPILADGTSLASFSYEGNYNAAKIFDLKGRLVKGGTGNKVFSISKNSPVWDGRDNDGNIVSSGVYQIVIYDSVDPTIKKVGKIAIVRK